ncbi:MAG: HlyD family efflux transporter periplasmic adaptor subunit [Deltaproteobacteria bacterium]|nr:HlyD family efflux transporter periplasmic adaptor subunit [Deltaproteobacteria bacterium]MBP7289371.1 HlyD family efflux transporter periplasmic adaptor subunit [Nannocystaceae bacterium]
MTSLRRWWIVGLFVCGCRDASSPAAAVVAAPPAATVRHGVHEGELAVVTLSSAAETALGIETATVTAAASTATRASFGIVLAPPGTTMTVAAPVAGTLRDGDVRLVAGGAIDAGATALRLVPLAPVDRDVKAQARRQSATTQARLDVAQARATRLESLMKDRAASARALEEARGELEAAQAEHDAAQARERALGRAPLSADVTLRVVTPIAGIVRAQWAAPGQVVAAGAPLFEVGPSSSLWLRVPMSAAERARLGRPRAIEVARLDDGDRWQAEPVAAPPSADPNSGDVDVVYALPAAAAGLAPGERLQVWLPEQARAATSVPTGALVRDFDGGTWVYACLGEHRYARRRVEVAATDGERLALVRSPELGTCIVTVGAAELLGTEFGVAH